MSGKVVLVRDFGYGSYMMGGRQDDISQEEFEEWQRFTSQNMEMEWLKGTIFILKMSRSVWWIIFARRCR